MTAIQRIIWGSVTGGTLAAFVVIAISSGLDSSSVTLRLTDPQALSSSVDTAGYFRHLTGVAMSEQNLARLAEAYGIYARRDRQPVRDDGARMRRNISVQTDGNVLRIGFRCSGRRSAQHVTAWLASYILAEDERHGPGQRIELVDPAFLPPEHPSVSVWTVWGALAGAAVGAFTIRRRA